MSRRLRAPDHEDDRIDEFSDHCGFRRHLQRGAIDDHEMIGVLLASLSNGSSHFFGGQQFRRIFCTVPRSQNRQFFDGGFFNQVRQRDIFGEKTGQPPGLRVRPEHFVNFRLPEIGIDNQGRVFQALTDGRRQVGSYERFALAREGTGYQGSFREDLPRPGE